MPGLPSAHQPESTLAAIVVYLQAGGSVSTIAIKRELGLTLPQIRAAFATQPWYSTARTPRHALMCFVYGDLILSAYRDNQLTIREIAQALHVPVSDVHAVVTMRDGRRERSYLSPQFVKRATVVRARAIVRKHGIQKAPGLLLDSETAIRRMTPGLTLPRGPRPSVDDAAIREQYQAGATIRAIARTLGVGAATVRRSLRRSRPLVL